MWSKTWLLLAVASALTLPLKPISAQASEPSEPVVTELYSNEEAFFQVGIEVGTPPQTLYLAIDTGFPYIAVADVDCTNCESSYPFDSKLSSSFRPNKTSTIGDLDGTIGFDQVYLEDAEKAVVPQQALLVVQNDRPKRLRQLSGLFGLAPAAPGQAYLPFLESLRKNRITTQSVIAVFIGVPGKDSAISFGSWDLSQFSTSRNFAYVDANTTAGLWEFAVSSVALGSISLQSLPLPAVINSTSANIVLPSAAYQKVKAYICGKVACFDRTKIVGFGCGKDFVNDFANLTFALNDVDVTVTSEAYLKRIYRKKRMTTCFLRIEEGDGERVVLGLPFMQSYYLLFDYENGRVGLAQANQYISYAWLYWLLGIGVGVILFLLIGACYLDHGCCCPQLSDLKERLLG